MAALIITVLLGLLFAWFATANNQSVSVNVAGNLLTIPLYMLAIVSVLIGLLVSAIISAIDSLSSMFALRSRDNKIRQREQTVEQLSTKIHDLELENARLRGEADSITLGSTPHPEERHQEHHGEKEKRPSIFDRFRYHPSP